MKRFIPLLMAIWTWQGLHSTAFSQNTEYYKKDTADRQHRQTTVAIPAEQDRKPVAASAVPMPLLDRLRLGGSFGLGFGYVTNINLSPMAGLNITDKLVGGVGVTYM